MSRKADSNGMELPDIAAIQKLNEAATKKLAEIVRLHGAGHRLWQGYNGAEIEAARELLSKSTSGIVR